MSLGIKFEAFKSYYDQGMAAYRAGDFLASKGLLERASQICKELSAQYPTSEMRQEFLKRSEDINNFIKNQLIQANKSTNSPPKPDGEKNSDEFLDCFEPITKLNNNITLNDIAGLDDVKDTVNKRLLLPMRNPGIYKLYGAESGGAVLMYGPPGTGKTMVAKAVANEAEASFFHVLSDELVDKYIGDTEKKISALFKKVRMHLPAVLFFDEFDSIASERSTDDKISKITVPQLIAQLEGIGNDTKNLLVLAATNIPWAIDGSLLSRFKNLYIPLPDELARAKIFFDTLSKDLVKNELDYIMLAEKTAGFSGREIARVCHEIRLTLATRHQQSGKHQLCGMQDLLDEIAIEKKRPKPSVIRYEQYNKDNADRML